MLEAVVVLEAVAQEAVETDVGQPDQTQGQDQRPVLPPTQVDQHGRQGCGVRRVIDDGSDAGPAEISRPRQVRQQDEGGYKPPWLPGGGVGGEGAGQQDRGLGSQPDPGAPETVPSDAGWQAAWSAGPSAWKRLVVMSHLGCELTVASPAAARRSA